MNDADFGVRRSTYVAYNLLEAQGRVQTPVMLILLCSQRLYAFTTPSDAAVTDLLQILTEINVFAPLICAGHAQERAALELSLQRLLAIQIAL